MRRLGASLIALAVATSALAQGSTPAPPPSPPGGAAAADDIGSELNSLATTLNLSSTQQAQARQILADRQAQVLAVRAEFPAPRPGAPPPPEGPVKMRVVMKEARSKMLAILNADQRLKYAELDKTGNAPPPPGSDQPAGQPPS